MRKGMISHSRVRRGLRNWVIPTPKTKDCDVMVKCEDVVKKIHPPGQDINKSLVAELPRYVGFSPHRLWGGYLVKSTIWHSFSFGHYSDYVRSHIAYLNPKALLTPQSLPRLLQSQIHNIAYNLLNFTWDTNHVPYSRATTNDGHFHIISQAKGAASDD